MTAGCAASCGVKSERVGARLGALLCVALAATALAYAQVRGHAFVELDDPQYVFGNAVVQAGLTRDGVRWAFTTTYLANWHPLTWLAHMLDCELFGLDAGAHHLVSLGLHLANTALVLLVLARLTGSAGRSAWVAALFALHPLHVESVAWISERKDVLSSLFGLLAIAAYARHATRPSVARLAVVAVCLALGLAAKPMLVSLPVVLLLLDAWPLGRFPAVPLRRLLLEKLPLAGLAAGSAAATLYAQRSFGSLASLEVVPLAARVGNAAVAYVAYLAKAFWPHPLAAYYPHPGPRPLWLVALAVALLAGLTVGAWRGRARRPWLLVGWLWYAVTLLPVIGLVQSGYQGMADRYTYLPLLGIFVVVVWSAAELCERLPRARRAALALGAAVLTALTAVTWLQAARWRDSLTLLEHTLRVTGPNPVAHLALGSALAREGRIDDAVAQIRAALEREPRLPEAHYNLAVLLARQGQLDEAISHYTAALETAPREARIHVQLGVALATRGRIDEAIARYREAVRLEAELAEARSNLGLALASRGELDAAAAELREALRRRPGFAAARLNLGSILVQQGRLDEAAAEYRELLRAAPALAAAHVNLGIVLARQGRRDEAIAQLREALAHAPEDPRALQMLRALEIGSAGEGAAAP